eukprot:376973-Pleurochrysis_carterae.AAC.2
MYKCGHPPVATLPSDERDYTSLLQNGTYCNNDESDGLLFIASHQIYDATLFATAALEDPEYE